VNWDKVLDVLGAADEDAWDWMGERAFSRVMDWLASGSAKNGWPSMLDEIQHLQRMRSAALD
jgi:hypothetical protein